MKKSGLIMILILVSILGILGACKSGEEMDLYNLKNRVREDYLQEFDRTFHFDRFYGVFNDSAVFFIEADDASIKTVVISGETFTGNSQWIILVWNDGKFYNLENIETILELGILTQENIIQLAHIHAEYDV